MIQVNFFSFSFAPATGLGYISKATITHHEVSMIARAVSFVAKSGTGKTTLLEKVIAELKDRGYRVGVIKHDAHRFDIDHPGKDSHRLTAAGADTMLISSPEKLALIKQHAEAPSIEELIATYFGDVESARVLLPELERTTLMTLEAIRQ